MKDLKCTVAEDYYAAWGSCTW